MRQIRLQTRLDRCDTPPFIVVPGWRIQRARLFATYFRYVYDHEGD